MTKRVVSLDLVKVIALLLMFFSHTVAFFYFGSNKLILFGQNWANLVCFISFLFVSGTAGYLAYLKIGSGAGIRGRLAKRFLLLLIGYYLLGIILNLKELTGLGLLGAVSEIAKILLFQRIPGYTEFLVPFLGYTGLFLLFRKQLKQLTARPIVLLILSVLLFGLGELLVRQLGDSGVLGQWGSLLYGSFSQYRFPLLQYFPVLVGGLLYGKVISDHKITLAELRAELVIGILVVSLGLVILLAAGPVEILRRWPPSIGFLTLGLAWTLLQLTLFEKLQLGGKGKVRELFIFISRNSLSLLIIHTALLSLGTQLKFPITNSAPVLFGVYLATTIVVVIGAYIWHFLANTFEHPTIRSVYKGVIISLTLVLLTVAVVVVNTNPKSLNQPGQLGANTSTIVKAPYWYDADSTYRLTWELSKDCCQTNPISNPETIIELNFEHSALVTNKLSRADGNDLVAVYWAQGKYNPAQIALKDLNTANSKAAISIPTREFPQDDTEKLILQLYSGNLFQAQDSSKNYPSNIDHNLSQAAATIANSRNIEVNELGMLQISINRLWYLKEEPLAVSFKLPTFTEESDAVSLQLFKVVNGNIEATPSFTRALNWNPNREYGISLNWPDLNLDFGDYFLQVQIDLGAASHQYILEHEIDPGLGKPYSDNTYKLSSNLVPIIYTAPVYTTWTIDWEGYDLAENYMKMMVELADKHQMPMTHYFNPRIYVNPAISPARANALTNWVKDREKKGDEIGLHLHMHLDLVAAAGVSPKSDPRWGGRTEGHDVLTSAYDETEYTKIVQWALGKFQEKGLSRPRGYRAGGWFLDLDNLKVLNKLGFTYDTSGSDFKEPYGPNKQPRTWDLTSTTRPYQVSSRNQNQSAPAPLLNIWEYPNNGANSTNKTSAELIRRLNQNLRKDNSTLANTEPQVLTYLSHPHWFNIDKPVMEALLNTAEKYKYNADNGPLVYVTQISAHEKYQAAIGN